MVDIEILNKATDKARVNGYVDDSFTGTCPDCGQPWNIFNHQFAKAFWGEDDGDGADYSAGCQYAWQYHLQQMVLEENPIKYLEKFL